MYRFIRPTIPEPQHWVPYLEQSYAAKYFSNFGPLATLLEQRLCSVYDSRRVAVGVANATAGLTACLHALGKQGKVVIPSFTFAATAQSVLLAGSEPVFCDVNEDTWLLDPEELERIILKEKPVAIMPVRSFGMYHDCSALAGLAKEYHIPLVLDSAPAFGGDLQSAMRRFPGEEETFEVFSFHATKVFGIGEGGVVFCPPVFEERFRRAVNFGLHGPDVVAVGGNAKLSEFNAAVALAMLDVLAPCVERRKSIARGYREALIEVSGVTHVWPETLSPWQTCPVLLRQGVDVDFVVSETAARGLELRRYYHLPLHQTTGLRCYADGRLPVSEDLSERIVCLPVYSDMRDEEQAEILSIFLDVLARAIARR
jgi:dTDP-4-amino-4,6-dideoxygalactose transaminase